MAGGSNGYRALLVRRQLTPGQISSLSGTAGLPPFISFSTSYPEMDPACDSPMRRISEVAHLASNEALQPTAGGASSHFSLMKHLSNLAKLALASGG